jgi:hypothetical protein
MIARSLKPAPVGAGLPEPSTHLRPFLDANHSTGRKREEIDADQLRAGAGQLGLGTGRRIEFVSAAAD